MEFSHMTQKWSSKPKEDRAARVRENQRRHRARTKAYISELEQQLSDTKAKLDKALSRTAELEAEVERLRNPGPGPATVPSSSFSSDPPQATGCSTGSTRGCSSSNSCSKPQPITTIRTSDISLAAPLPCSTTSPLATTSVAGDDSTVISDDLTHDASLLLALGEEQLGSSTSTTGPLSSWSGSSGSGGGCSPQSALPPTTIVSNDQVLGVSPLQILVASNNPGYGTAASDTSFPCACDTPDMSQPGNASGGAGASESNYSADADCTHLPPPGPGESTIHCKAAYRIIEERNFKGMDVGAIKSWLGPGFRRAIIQGDGCRVDSHLVFALIDDISAG
ncbi:hypothetical protein MKZ38_007359 [Zalerion maritima]|uniref:BZIP domain-containing protein n=1 Tax=Zalerion maritima TaxID=339359 RepID=A0AAD5WWJ2_9PEZI|nr:hypothetical protein MKZ38_007359 [Zalerion maritima]